MSKRHTEGSYTVIVLHKGALANEKAQLLFANAHAMVKGPMADEVDLVAMIKKT